MQIAHVALWTTDLDGSSKFWTEYFEGSIGEEYASNRRKGFRSRFVTLKQGPTIELMTGPWLASEDDQATGRHGWAHIAISVGSQDAVRSLADRFEAAGLLVSSPRTTGDGYFEAVGRTPDGSLVEITE